MRKIPLYFNKADNSYVHVGSAVCDLCDVEQHNVIIVKSMWDKKHSSLKLYCLDCFEKIKENSSVEEIRGAKIVYERPKKSFLVLFKPPVLVNGRNETVFSMAEKNFDGEDVDDQTRLADRESWGDAQIGLDPEKVDSKDQVLDNGAVDSLLLAQQTAEPVLEHDKKRFIE